MGLAKSITLSNLELTRFFFGIVLLLISAHTFGYIFQKYKMPKVIGEITDQLIFYAQAYTSKNVKKELHDEASETFRKSAGRLQVYYNLVDWMSLFGWFVPSRKDVDKATGDLIGLSNATPPRDRDATDNSKRANSIRKLLKIKYYGS